MLVGWGELIEIYCKTHALLDVPYFYNERANISLIASGAWHKGLIALEEYMADKKESGGGSRADLYVSQKDDEKSAVIEAKQKWITPGTKADTIIAGIKSAKDSASKNIGVRNKIGMCFYTLKLRSSLDSGNNEEIVRELIQENFIKAKWQGGGKFDAVAWSFPEICHDFKQLNKKTQKTWFWPGVIVGLSLVRR